MVYIWFYISNSWPIDKMFDDRLFSSFKLSTVVLNLLAMEYNVSPFCTIYFDVDVVLGISRVWPTESKLVVRLFSSFNSSTVMLLVLAIEYNVSPLFTVYVCLLVVSVSITSPDGINNIWPIDKVFDVKLFNCFKLSTVVLYFCDIEYRVSPFSTKYVSVNSVVGILSSWPIFILFVVKLFNCLMLSTVVLYFLDIEYRVSPFWTVYVDDCWFPDGAMYGIPL